MEETVQSLEQSSRGDIRQEHVEEPSFSFILASEILLGETLSVAGLEHVAARRGRWDHVFLSLRKLNY